VVAKTPQRQQWWVEQEELGKHSMAEPAVEAAWVVVVELVVPMARVVQVVLELAVPLVVVGAVVLPAAVLPAAMGVLAALLAQAAVAQMAKLVAPLLALTDSLVEVGPAATPMEVVAEVAPVVIGKTLLGRAAAAAAFPAQ
jgi:hypothetical protein